MGILVGLFMGIIGAIAIFVSTRSIGHALLAGSAIAIVSGAAFGGLMAVIIGAWRIQAREALDRSAEIEKPGVCHSKDVEVDAPYDIVFDRAIHAVGSGHITREDREGGRIEATMPAARRNDSEKISLVIHGREGGVSIVSITSENPVKAIAGGGSGGLCNIDLIIRRLKSQGA